MAGTRKNKVTKETVPANEKCPHCGAERKIPMYVYAHWQDEFTVHCENPKCGLEYYFYQGQTYA